MHKRLAEVIEYVESRRAELLRSFSTVSRERLAMKPGSGGWSAAEVIDHLRIVEGGIARLFAKRIAQAKESGLRSEDSTESVLGSLDHMGDFLDHGKIEAPAMVRPGGQIDVEEAIGGLHSARESLRTAILTGDGLALGDIKHPHPVLGELDFYQWLVFVGRHEARHTRQIQRTLAGLETR